MGIALTETEQVEISRRPMRIVEPMPQKHRPFQYEPIPIVTDAEAIEQPLESVLSEKQLEWFVALL
ncbi:hypothetical protein GCM10007874_45990 [Labrys miyagiensis]|uniref:Uncharacterized protein n=1 Tax=Labrys miyagiensis TaxID=346912 RepID=A0ABQ6CTK1_9HYPH|nr:hypothetical protein GCM10007874_45990 [Labrys miyagiensis]